MDVPDTSETNSVEVPGTIFCQPWWLDAVAPGRWDAVEISANNRPVARMPYVWNQGRPDRLTMPMLTQCLGPWMDLGNGKLNKRLARQKDLAGEIIAQLPTFRTFRQNFHYSIDNWLPWYWHNFSQTTRYTYVLNDLTNTDRLWDGFSSSVKGDIRKAQKHVEIETPDSSDEFFELNELVFRRQSKPVPYTRAFIDRLDDVCRERGRRKIFIARGADGKTHAGCYLVWDSESAYYLMGGGHPELRRSGATSLCMWKAIQFAAQVTEKFDFEGSMMEPVERFFRSFGATPTPYFEITKSNETSTQKSKRYVLGHIRKPLSLWKRR